MPAQASKSSVSPSFLPSARELRDGLAADRIQGALVLDQTCEDAFPVRDERLAEPKGVVLAGLPLFGSFGRSRRSETAENEGRRDDQRMPHGVVLLSS